jgi:hypothetical protein
MDSAEKCVASCFAFGWVFFGPAVAKAEVPAVGAIRWNAWYGSKDSAGACVEERLSEPKWQYRLPFFSKKAKEVNDTFFTTNGDSSVVMPKCCTWGLSKLECTRQRRLQQLYRHR